MVDSRVWPTPDFHKKDDAMRKISCPVELHDEITVFVDRADDFLASPVLPERAGPTAQFAGFPIVNQEMASALD